jgi:hypothetical protein
MVKEGQGLSKGAYMVPISFLYPLHMLSASFTFSIMVSCLPQSSPDRTS